jgi:hypothetical protein
MDTMEQSHFVSAFVRAAERQCGRSQSFKKYETSAYMVSNTEAYKLAKQCTLVSNLPFRALSISRQVNDYPI